jgi:hypothetical protein
MAALKATAKQAQAPNSETLYYVWHAAEGNAEDVPPGKYLVDDQGKINYLVDPGISGKLRRQDDGTEVRKYNPPQAELFALITNGILTKKLPWELVLLGVSIAIVVELCGVSSLAFAVGVYLPLSTSAPIFVGGLVRHFVEKAQKKRSESAATELESEMSPATLLSTGYIAGGTLAGVLIAFLNFNDTTVNTLSVWQYRKAPVEAADTFDAQCLALAKQELGDAAPEQKLKHLAAQIRELNESQLRRYVPVPGGTAIKLPKNQRFTFPADSTLAEVAQKAMGSDDKASLLFDLNDDHLKLPESLPAGTLLKLPQRNALALVAFAVLAMILVATGMGWILKTPVPAKSP